MSAIRSAFPDPHVTIEDQIAEQDRVVTRVTFRGTHPGEFSGVAATGRVVTYSGIAIDRIANGKSLPRQIRDAKPPAPQKGEP